MNLFEKDIADIKACFLTKALPGMSSQLKMAPVTRLADIVKSMSPKEDGVVVGKAPRKSAILVLLYPKNDSVYLAMMVRATDDTVHSGQISFPGGKVEKTDLSMQYTALRETYEEIGIPADSIEIIGELSKLYIPPSNFDVFPIVGTMKNTPVFSTNNEVQKLLEIELVTLINPNAQGYHTINHRMGNEFVVPCFKIQGEIIWGASAMILSEFLELIK